MEWDLKESTSVRANGRAIMTDAINECLAEHWKGKK